MALPDNKKSNYKEEIGFLSPDDLPYSPLAVSQLGGLDLQDTSKGLRYQVWTLRYDGNLKALILEAKGKYYKVIEGVEPPVTLDLAFDQNMNYCVCYTTKDNKTILKWFNASTLTFVTDTYGNTINGHLTLDDKREEFTDTSDIIFGYIKTSNRSLNYRQQRDRFTVERELAINLPEELELIKIGMTLGNRLRFQVTKQVLLPECGV